MIKHSIRNIHVYDENVSAVSEDMRMHKTDFLMIIFIHENACIQLVVKTSSIFLYSAEYQP